MAELGFPVGFTGLMERFTSAVAAAQPASVEQFAVQYFSQQAQPGGEHGALRMMVEVTDAENEEEDDLDDAFFPPTVSIQRRKSICGEVMDPQELMAAPRVVHFKTAEQTGWLHQAIKPLFLFQSLPQDELGVVVDAMFRRETVPGECVIVQGDDADNFYVVESGLFDVYVQGVHVGAYDNAGYFGELALMYNCPRAATILSVGHGALWALDRTTFQRSLRGQALYKRSLYESFLEGIPLLSDLSRLERLRLADALEPRTFHHDELIICQGDPADAFFFIITGTVRVMRRSELPFFGTSEIEVARLTAGQYFGELALLTKKPRAASIYAVGDVSCARLTTDAFERLLGPCMDVMKRSIGSYEDRLRTLFGPSDKGSYLGLELSTL